MYSEKRLVANVVKKFCLLRNPLFRYCFFQSPPLNFCPEPGEFEEYYYRSSLCYSAHYSDSIPTLSKQHIKLHIILYCVLIVRIYWELVIERCWISWQKYV